MAPGWEPALALPPGAGVLAPAPRWAVERICARLGRNRRLIKDYESLPAIKDGWIYLGMSRLLLRRVAR